MKIIEKKRNKNTISLKIETEFTDVSKKTDEIFKKESEKYRIPGFRKGKAPRDVFDQHFGKGFLLEKALNDVISACYTQAVRQESLSPVDYPQNVEIVEFEEEKPLIFMLSVTVSPEVKLKKYKGLKTEQKTVQIKEGQVDHRLEELRENLAEYMDTDRPTQKDDIIRYDINAETAGQPLAAYTLTNQGTRLGLNRISPEFDEQLIGVKTGEAKSFQLSFPNDHADPNLRGKTVDFSVLLTEVKEKKLPALDNSFAAKVSEYKTLPELKDKLKEAMTNHARSEAETAMKEKLLDELVSQNPTDIPQVMIDRQVDMFIDRLKASISQQKLSWENYLQFAKKSVDALRQEYQEPARKRVATDLILAKIIEEEKIEASDEDLEKEFARIAEQEFKKPLEEIRSQLQQGEVYIKEYLAINKAIDFVIEHAKIKTIKA